jgi:hypothetical protein
METAKERIVELRKEGLTYLQIRDEIGVSMTYIHRVLRDAGMTRSREKIQAEKKARRDREVAKRLQRRRSLEEQASGGKRGLPRRSAG